MDGTAPPSPIDRIVALADQCVLCGLCLPHCPTYQLDRIEAESPRGRIMQFRGLALGEIAATDAAKTHLDHCLGCRNCEPVCPARVRYGELLVEGRALLRSRRPASLGQRLLEWLVAHPGRMAALAGAGRALARLAPAALRARLPLLRRGAALSRERRWPVVTAAAAASRGRVGLLLGCASRHAQADALAAAVRVLSRLGWDVQVPADQGCCGALARHAGRPDEAERLAAANAAAFAGVERLLVLDSGCVESQQSGAGGLPVEELLAFIARDPALDALLAGGRSASHARPDRDGLARKPANTHAPRSQPWAAPAEERVLALHLPCTQRNVTGNAATVRDLLVRLGFTVNVVGERGCCGAAGSHMLLEPARAAMLRAPLLDAIAASGAATLATGNIGCRMHLADALAGVRVLHPIELLDQCLD
jgi:glycolate oxidase iron-sulfur subunit